MPGDADRRSGAESLSVRRHRVRAELTRMGSSLAGVLLAVWPDVTIDVVDDHGAAVGQPHLLAARLRLPTRSTAEVG